MDFEGSDVIVVNGEVQAAAVALDDFIYGKGGQEESGEKAGETADENVEKPDESIEKPEENAEKPDEKPDEKREDKAVPETNGGAEQQTHEGEDQEMKEATSADA